MRGRCARAHCVVRVGLVVNPCQAQDRILEDAGLCCWSRTVYPEPTSCRRRAADGVAAAAADGVAAAVGAAGAAGLEGEKRAAGAAAGPHSSATCAAFYPSLIKFN